jgi:hypothetical protein
MTLPRQQPVTAVGIGRIRTILDDPNPNPRPGEPVEETQSATAVIQVIMSDGTSREVRANIPTYFPTAVNQLIGFAAAVRTKANNEILGG